MASWASCTRSALGSSMLVRRQFHLERLRPTVNCSEGVFSGGKETWKRLPLYSEFVQARHALSRAREFRGAVADQAVPLIPGADPSPSRLMRLSILTNCSTIGSATVAPKLAASVVPVAPSFCDAPVSSRYSAMIWRVSDRRKSGMLTIRLIVDRSFDWTAPASRYKSTRG